jgi:hypothetical protein
LGLPEKFFEKFHFSHHSIDVDEKRLRIAEYLLEKGIDENNPMTYNQFFLEAKNKLGLTYYDDLLHLMGSKRLGFYNPVTSPANAGVRYRDGKIYVEDSKKVMKYIELMKEAIKMLKLTKIFGS